MTREDIQTPFSCLPYRLEKLGNRLFLAVSDEHRFGSDAFLLADYCWTVAPSQGLRGRPRDRMRNYCLFAVQKSASGQNVGN